MMGIGKHDSKVWLVKAMCEASMRSHLSWGGLRWPRSVPLYYSRERQPELSCCMIFGGWLEEGLCVMLVAVVFFNYHDIDKAFSWPDIVDLLLGYLTLGGLTRAKRERGCRGTEGLPCLRLAGTRAPRYLYHRKSRVLNISNTAIQDACSSTAPLAPMTPVSSVALDGVNDITPD